MPSEGSAAVAARVARARQAQMQRQGKLNSCLSIPEIGRVCRLERDSRGLLGRAIERLGLSARAYHRLLKVARTCADLAGESQVRMTDVSEAVCLRTLDRIVR